VLKAKPGYCSSALLDNLMATGENKIAIGLVRHLPDGSSAWDEVERLDVPIDSVDVRRGLTLVVKSLTIISLNLFGFALLCPAFLHGQISGRCRYAHTSCSPLGRGRKKLRKDERRSTEALVV
jgi:hypothetical protein